ncbi:hypothetical protein HDU78_008224 [Chytriomyces hyalinus]|nr:hypothetical protein HDU78_008224 [Chytriomyces hyalinus]
MDNHQPELVDATLHQLHFIVPAILCGISVTAVVYLISYVVRVEYQQRPYTSQSLLMNALLVALLLCEAVHAFLIALSNYYYFIEPSTYQAIAYLLLGVGESVYAHFAYFRSRPIIRSRVTPQIALAIRVTVHATPIIVPIPGILYIIACFHPLPKSIIPYAMTATTAFIVGIDLAFIWVFASQIRAMQSDIAVNPPLVIIARYGLLANSSGVFGIVCFILSNIFSRAKPGGVGHIVCAFLTQILVWSMCMVCLVMKVKLVKLKDSEDVAYSGLADDTHFRNNQQNKQ